MSIVVYRNGIMASDSGSWNGDYLVESDSPKVFKVRGHLLGCLGQKAVTQRFLTKFRDTGRLDASILVDDKSTVMVVTPQRRLFLYQIGAAQHFQGPFYADGADSAVALGALHAGATAIQAVKIVSKIGAWARGKTQSVRL